MEIALSLNYKTDEFGLKSVSDMEKHLSKEDRGNGIYYGAIDFCEVRSHS